MILALRICRSTVSSRPRFSAMATARSFSALSGSRIAAPLHPRGASDKSQAKQTKRSFHSPVPSRASVSLANSESFLTGSAGYHALLTSSKSKSLNKEYRRYYVGSARAEAAVAESDAQTPAGEKFEYQAEVSRLLDLIVHSLYSHKEVFLRELVSNASDALDKMRFLSLTEPALLEATQDLYIRIKSDPDAGTITITDTGVGMTREELVDSLGTIAQSGTAKFAQALKEKQEQNAVQDSNLIGQFGVGFYSAFLVADKITVSTKSPKSDKQFVWESEADSSSYTIREETDSSKLLPRGTSICLHLKPEEKFEYTSQERIESLVKNYSQFISFPIYTWKELTRDKEVEEIEEPKEEGGEPVKTTKTIQEKYYDWELANETKPIWVRSPKDVKKEEYDEFYKATFKEFLDPLGYTHFNTEGEIEFKSLLYIPGMNLPGKDDPYRGKTKNIRLYVKRVFISDEFDGELFPRYLYFVQGVVDSNDLPLNVSREILQESRIVRIMKKRLVRKTFDLLDEIAAREGDDYLTFWKDFGKYIKVGCIEDSANHNRLAPLLRFFSSKSEEKLITLSDYVSRMKEDQKDIYFLSADTISSAKSAPFLEKLQKKDLEVLFLIDPVDEVAVTTLANFEGKSFVDISKEDLDLGDEEEDLKETQKEFTLLCDWMKQRLGEKVAKVQVSNRITNSPCVLVSGKFGWSANMERLMKAQALADPQQVEFMKGRRILEINPTHPIIKQLDGKCKSSPNDPKAERLVELLYQTANLSSGFTPDNPAEFGSRVYEVMSLALGADIAPSPSQPTPESQPQAEKTDVVEASEILTEDDPWKK